MSFPAQRLSWLAAIADQLVDDRTGVLNRIRFEEDETALPGFFHCQGHLCNLGALGWVGFAMPFEGASWHRERAATKTLAEGLRLYASSFYRNSELPLYPAVNAPFRCIDPAAFSLRLNRDLRQSDLPQEALTNDSCLRWVPGRNILTDEVIHVPAALVYFPYVADQGAGERPMTPCSTTGLAFGRDLSDAALAGVCDVIQADAISLCWLAARSPPQIRVETVSDLNYELISRFEATGADVTLLDLRTEVKLPVVLACLSDRSQLRPALVLAAGADPDPEEALTIALEELAVARRLAHDCMFAPSGRADANVSTRLAHSPAKNLKIWCDPANADLASFLFASNKRIELGEIPPRKGRSTKEALEAIVSALGQLGYETLLHDLTPPDLKQLGAHVARVVIPGYHPSCISRDCPSLSGRRFQAALKAFGDGKGYGIRAPVPAPPLLERGLGV